MPADRVRQNAAHEQRRPCAPTDVLAGEVHGPIVILVCMGPGDWSRYDGAKGEEGHGPHGRAINVTLLFALAGYKNGNRLTCFPPANHLFPSSHLIPSHTHLHTMEAFKKVRLQMAAYALVSLAVGLVSLTPAVGVPQCGRMPSLCLIHRRCSGTATTLQRDSERIQRGQGHCLLSVLCVTQWAGVMKTTKATLTMNAPLLRLLRGRLCALVPYPIAGCVCGDTPTTILCV